LGTVVIEQYSLGGNPCYMDLSYTLGLQYHLVTGDHHYDHVSGERETGWAGSLIQAIHDLEGTGKPRA
jgi:hypothetical protein